MAGYLFDQVKRKLNITWSDPDTDAHIDDIVSNALPIMAHKLGTTTDKLTKASDGGYSRALFLNYCLYEYNHRAHEFDMNYSAEIAQAREIYLLEEQMEVEQNE